MALFSTGKKEPKAKRSGAARKIRKARQVKLSAGRAHEVLHAPWFSEKALIQTERGVYAFAVPREATKAEIAGAVQAVYGVAPKRVRIVNLPGKPSAASRGSAKAGRRATRRKAYVYLSAGDTIQFA